MTFGSLLKQPTAFIPLLMSAAAFLLIIIVQSATGVTRPEDEGAPARIFQILILLQVPIIGFSAMKWWPLSPRGASFVLFLQIGTAILAVATVVWFENHGGGPTSDLQQIPPRGTVTVGCILGGVHHADRPTAVRPWRAPSRLAT